MVNLNALPVGKSSHANSDPLQDTITFELMHDQWWLYLSWLLVGVRHKTTDKVRVTIVEGLHELTKRDKVN